MFVADGEQQYRALGGANTQGDGWFREFTFLVLLREWLSLAPGCLGRSCKRRANDAQSCRRISHCRHSTGHRSSLATHFFAEPTSAYAMGGDILHAFFLCTGLLLLPLLLPAAPLL